MRQWASSLLSFTILGLLLFSCLTPSISIADVFLNERGPTIPASDVVLEASHYTMKSPLAVRSMLAQSWPGACFSADDQRNVRHIDDKSTWLTPSNIVCVSLRADVHETGWSGYEAKGDHARSTENWSDARQAYSRAVELLGRTTAQEGNLDLASLLNKLGAMLSMQHDIAGAEVVHRRALAIYTSIGGADDLRVANTLDLLAAALSEEPTNRGLAGALFFRTWAIRERVLGPEHPAVADSLHRVALTLYADHLSLAMQLLLRAREIRIRVFGPDDASVAESLSAMALMYEVHQRRDLAIPLYQEALSIREKVFGPHSSQTFGNTQPLKHGPSLDGPP